jgi:hypothetical protein
MPCSHEAPAINAGSLTKAQRDLCEEIKRGEQRENVRRVAEIRRAQYLEKA